MSRGELHGERFGERPHRLLHRSADDRDVDVKPLRAARLDERFHLQRCECVADDTRRLAYLIEGRALPGVEIEVDIVGTIDIVTPCVPLIEVDAPQVDQPEQRGHVVDDREIDDVAGLVLDGARANPGGTRHRRPLHEEEFARGTVRITLHHHRAVPDVRKQDSRNVRVILDQRAFRNAPLRPEGLLQVREAHLAPRDHQLRVVYVGRNLYSRRFRHWISTRRFQPRRARRTRRTIGSLSS